MDDKIMEIEWEKNQPQIPEQKVGEKVDSLKNITGVVWRDPGIGHGFS